MNDYQDSVDLAAYVLANASNAVKGWLVHAAEIVDDVYSDASASKRIEKIVPGFQQIFCDWRGLELQISGVKRLSSEEKIRDAFLDMLVAPPGSMKDIITGNEKRSFLNGLNSIISSIKNIETELQGGGDSDKEAEAPDDSELGKYAFSPGRKGKVPFEPNTEIEQELQDNLIQYFENNEPVPLKNISLIKTLMSQGLYTKILHEPTVATLYRGMIVPEDWLKRSMEGEKIKFTGRKKANFTFSPAHGRIQKSSKSSSSWSQTYGVARNFANDVPIGKKDQYYGVVMRASVGDNPGNFLACPGGLYDVKAFTGFGDEAEAIGLGKIKVFEIEWFGLMDE